MIGLILTAAGSGSRFRDPTPKQFHLISEVPVFVHALRPFLGIVEETALVVPGQWLEWVGKELLSHRISCTHLLAGGRQRQDSVRIGLDALSEAVDTVLVHDGARPFVTEKLISHVLGGIQGGGCIPVLPVSETVKEVEGARVLRTLDRDRLRLVQTPQGFPRDALAQAFDLATREKFYGTDEASLVERLGRPVVVVDGDPANRKVTYAADLGE